MQEQILSVYSQYPWASDETAEKIAESLRGSPANRQKIAMIIANSFSPATAQKLQRILDEDLKEEQKSVQSDKELGRSLQSVQRTLMLNNVDGMGAIATLFRDMSAAASELELGNKAESFFGGLTKNKNKLIKGLGYIGEGGAKIIGSGAGISAGVGVFVAKFINSQDKLLKAMIDSGMADANMENMTALRQGSARLGVGFDEFAKILNISRNLTTTTSESAVEGAIKFSDFVYRVSRDDSITKFGYRNAELAEKLGIVANALYQSNTISSLDRNAQDKIVQVFTTTQNIALGLAAATGENRNKLLQELEKQQESVELNTSFQLASKQYIEERGETAFTNMKLGSQMFMASLSSLLGANNPMVAEIEKALKAAAFDLNYDQTVVNNLSPELIQMLNEAGPGALKNITTAMDNILQGNTNQEQALVDATSFIGLLSDRYDDGLRRYASVDPITEATVKVLAAAKTANEKAKNVTLADVNGFLEQNQKGLKATTGAIKAVDQAAIALTTTLEAILPGIDTLDTTLDLMYGVGDFTASILNAVKKLFGADTTESGKSLKEIRDEINTASLARDAVVYAKGSKQYQERSELMRKGTGEGTDITARSIATYIAATQGMLTEGQMANADPDELDARQKQLVENLQLVKKKQYDRKGNLITDVGKLASLQQQQRIFENQLAKLNLALKQRNKMLSESEIKNTSEQELIRRKEALVENLRKVKSNQTDRKSKGKSDEQIAKLKIQERILEEQIAKLTSQLNAIEEGSILEETP